MEHCEEEQGFGIEYMALMNPGDFSTPIQSRWYSKNRGHGDGGGDGGGDGDRNGDGDGDGDGGGDGDGTMILQFENLF